MDPSNVKAAEGTSKVEILNPETDTYCEVDDIGDSENEVNKFLMNFYRKCIFVFHEIIICTIVHIIFIKT